MKSEFEKNIIFIGGIHGVGKTTLCRQISKEVSINHYSASELISKLKLDNIAQDKKVKNVSENQNILLEAINKYFNSDKRYLLDGHFCLINSNNDIVSIPLDTFKALGIKLIVVLIDDENEILKKLACRDSKEYSFDFIKEFQEREISYAKEVAKQIGVRCEIVNVKSEINEILKNFGSILNN